MTSLSFNGLQGISLRCLEACDIAPHSAMGLNMALLGRLMATTKGPIITFKRSLQGPSGINCQSKHSPSIILRCYELLGTIPCCLETFDTASDPAGQWPESGTLDYSKVMNTRHFSTLKRSLQGLGRIDC